MNVGIIKSILDNSTWIDNKNKNIYKFFNQNDLAINGVNHSHYFIQRNNNQIALKLSTNQIYFVEYVNDFHLIIYNNDEKFKIIPE